MCCTAMMPICRDTSAESWHRVHVFVYTKVQRHHEMPLPYMNTYTCTCRISHKCIQNHLVKAHSYVLNEQQSCFKAIYVAIVQYDAGRFNLRSLSTAEYKVPLYLHTLYSAVDDDFWVETSCIILNYCYACC